MAKPGPRPAAGENRDRYLRVRLASFEETGLDARRGGASRSEYVRELIRRDVERGGSHGR